MMYAICGPHLQVCNLASWPMTPADTSQLRLLQITITLRNYWRKCVLSRKWGKSLVVVNQAADYTIGSGGQ